MDQLDQSISEIEADPRRVQQIISNLLINAIKYTPYGGQITVTSTNSYDKAQLRIKFLEDELLKKEKVETIAKMVISIAHEINNPLTVIMGGVEMLLMKKEELSKDMVEKLETVLSSTLRIRDVVARMTKINSPVDTAYAAGKKMIDIWKSG